MSSIFDNVDIATSRRKNKVLDTGQVRDIFGGHGTSHMSVSNIAPTPMCTLVYANTAERPPEIQYMPSSTQGTNRVRTKCCSFCRRFDSLQAARRRPSRLTLCGQYAWRAHSFLCFRP